MPTCCLWKENPELRVCALFQGETLKMFPCPECDSVYVHKHHLKRHMQIHTGQFSFYCQVCRRGFNNDTNFKNHMRGHEGLKYECRVCGKSFVSKFSYDSHQSHHTGQYKFTCEHCDKGFNARKIFENHQAFCASEKAKPGDFVLSVTCEVAQSLSDSHISTLTGSFVFIARSTMTYTKLTVLTWLGLDCRNSRERSR